MQKSIFNKKDWLINHAEYVLELRNKGLPHQQIIQNLKDKLNMPFDIEPSLFSRHLKVILENQGKVTEQVTHVERFEDLLEYTNYLENSNKDLLQKIKELKLALQHRQEINLPKDIQVLELKQRKLNDTVIAQQEQIQNLELNNSKLTENLASLQVKNDQLMLQNLEMIHFDTVKQENIALKKHIRRFKAYLDESTREASYFGEKLNTAQNRANKSFYLNCILSFVVLMMVFVLLISKSY